MPDIAIRVENLSKFYHIGRARQRHDTLRDAVVGTFARWNVSTFQRSNVPTSDDTLWALRDVSFEVKRGEVVGVIGRNGAGKSTLLKILSRITEPTSGRAEIHGRVGSLLEVGTGFHPELTGRENIYLNGAILGMKRVEIARKFDEIVAFAEIERFLDTPVKRYSSGMYVRLAFAVAAHLEPEILLVDEVLAVGDAAFQKKCLRKMGDVAREGRTVILVSHNMASIRQLCETCLWLDTGALREAGPISNVIDTYLEETNTANAANTAGECYFELDTSKEFQLRAARLLNQSGECIQSFQCDEPVIIEMVCQVHRQTPGLYGYLTLSRNDGILVWVSDSYDVPPNPLDELSVGYHAVRITVLPRTLAPGDYTVYANFASLSGKNDFNVDSPGNILFLHLDDHTSRRGNKRGGYFSTLLTWQVTSPESEHLLALRLAQSTSEVNGELV